MIPEQFDFDYTIELNMLAGLLLPSTNLLVMYYPYLKSSYWQDYVLSDYVAFSLRFFAKYKAPPTLVALADYIKSDIPKIPLKLKLIEQYKTVWQELAKIISNGKSTNFDYSIDRLVDFVHRKELEKSAIKLLEGLDSCRPLADLKTIGQTKLPSGSLDLGLDLGSLKSLKNPLGKIPTHIPELDRTLKGGISPGEVGVILGPANVGKTTILVWLGIAGLFSGCNVLYYTLEMAAQPIAEKYFRAIGKESAIYNQESIYDEKEDLIIKPTILKKLNFITKAFGGRLFIKEFNKVSANELKAHIAQCRTLGVYPGLIIIDHLFKMKPVDNTRNYSGESSFYGACCEDIIDMSKEEQVPVWTTIHSNRAAHSKKVLNLDDCGLSYEVAKLADIVPALCQTKEEYEQKRMRIVMAKNRKGIKNQTIYIDVDFDKMSIKPSDYKGEVE